MLICLELWPGISPRRASRGNPGNWGLYVSCRPPKPPDDAGGRVPAKLKTIRPKWKRRNPMYPIYYDHQFIIIGNPRQGKTYDGEIDRNVASVIAAGSPKLPVHVINPEENLIKGLKEAGISFTVHESKQPRHTGGCAWYMPVKHKLQGRPWSEERIEKFFI